MTAAAAHRSFGGPLNVGVGVTLAGTALATLLVVGAVLGTRLGSGPLSDVDIPPDYLALYQAAAERYGLGPIGWSVLAGVGKVECDHGRSAALGCHRREANSAGAQGPAQFLPGTWGRYGVDADGDGRRDVYDPADAVFGMARYLRASGAPSDWRHAVFAYNHAGWYVDQVLAQAAAYRAEGGPIASPETMIASGSGSQLAPVPDFPGIRCDARIVPDVTALSRAFGVRVTACFGGAPHAIDGEHPLGLAVDLVPADGDWRRTEALARRFGWSERCARSGCPGAGPFRVVLYNGYRGHGDPRHSAEPHLHLSWQHAPARPFTRAAWVRVLVPPTHHLNGAARCAKGDETGCIPIG